MKTHSKVVFIVIARGFIVRNILRSGILEGLIKAGHQVVIFFPKGNNEETDALRKEFTSPAVSVEFLPQHAQLGRIKNYLYKFFKKVSAFLVYSQSTWIYSRIGNSRIMMRNIFWAYVEKYFYGTLAHFAFLKTIARYLESYFFFSPVYRSYFERYKPSLVFSTSIISKEDIQFMKEAKHRGVKTVSMPKGWDNISKMFYSVLPDILILQNNLMKEDAVRLQKMPMENIAVCGFPQFDWYKKTDILMSRDELMEILGFSPERKLIFFGSEGMWAPYDHVIAMNLAEKINKRGVFNHDCAMLVRPHFSDIYNKRFESLRGIPNVKVDDNYTLSKYFNDNWNPSLEETKLFTNCIYHCDVLITTASTLVLDAACCNKPLIGVSYGVLYKEGKDISSELYDTDHFRAVIRTNAVNLVKSEKELVEGIHEALRDPTKRYTERVKLIEDLCFKADGKSSGRIVDVLLKNLQA